MLAKIYTGVAASIFVGGCALLKGEVFEVMPVLVMVSVGWPVIVANNVMICLKN